MTRRNVIFKAVSVLALVWSVVWGIRTYADSLRDTAQRVAREMADADFADWSNRNVPPDNPEAMRRDRKLGEIAGMVNALDFQERDAYRRDHTEAAFLGKLDPREKGRFLDLTVMESFKRFMKSLDAVTVKQSKEFIEQAIREYAQGRSEKDIARAKAGADMLTEISPDAVRAYLENSSTDTKLKLAPLIETVNETMEGLRGNEFGRHRQ